LNEELLLLSIFAAPAALPCGYTGKGWTDAADEDDQQ